MTSTKIKLRPSSAMDRPGSVVYMVTKDGVTRQVTTDHRLFPREWDEERSSAVPSMDERLQAIGRNIRHDARRLGRIIHELDGSGRGYTAGDVVAEFLRIGEEASLFGFMEDAIVRLGQLGRAGTAMTYRSTLGSLRRFRMGEDVSLKDVEAQLVEDYGAWLRASGLAPNTVSFYMKVLRAAYNRAVGQGLTRDRKPFHTVCTRAEKTRKRAITPREMRRIRDLDLSSRPHLELARDMFLFLFYCRGMAFVDAAHLKKEDISCGVLSYHRNKTGQALHVRVVPEIQDIINRYPSPGSPYLLPIIGPNGDSRRQYETGLRKTNRALKEIGRMVNLAMPLTTYVSRHSWATIAQRKNVPLAIISEALGHDSEATTQIYIASIDPATIDRANSLVIRGLGE